MSEDHRATVEAFLDAIVRKDVDAIVDIHTEDAILEFPFAPPGFPPRVEGRDAIRVFEAPISESVASSSFHDLTVRPLAEPDMAVAEYRGEVTLTNGRNYDNTYCLVVQFRDGLMHHVREYFNPLVIQSAGLVAGDPDA
jgi:ketosteroid isomerase-like protein